MNKKNSRSVTPEGKSQLPGETGIMKNQSYRTEGLDKKMFI